MECSDLILHCHRQSKDTRTNYSCNVSFPDTFLLSSTNATKTYGDIDYAPLNVLKAEISAVSGCAIGNLPPPAGPRFMNGAPVTLAKDIFPTNVVAEAPAGDEV